jgi:hypothetical protein
LIGQKQVVLSIAVFVLVWPLGHAKQASVKGGVNTW